MENLYYFPESFSINNDDKKFYTEFQLKYLSDIQKYLLSLGVKDIGEPQYDENGCYIDID